MSPSDLAQRIARMDWSGVSLQHLLAVTAACETLKACHTLEKETPMPESNVVPLRNCGYVPARRVYLTLLDGTPFADALCSREERWDWIVATVTEELRCYPEQVGCDDDTVTVDGMPCYLIA